MAIHINRVYTRNGDGGKTSLVGNMRVDKDCQKLESFGTVDELNCLVGAARTAILEDGSGLPKTVREDLGTNPLRAELCLGRSRAVANRSSRTHPPTEMAPSPPGNAPATTLPITTG